MMEQFARGITPGATVQPVTDIPGALLAHLAGPVAAYNWLVLLTFPLAALAAYALARHLALPPVGAALAAFAFAFSPFHFAHAAYHPHIAQTVAVRVAGSPRSRGAATWLSARDRGHQAVALRVGQRCGHARVAAARQISGVAFITRRTGSACRWVLVLAKMDFTRLRTGR